MVLLSTQQWTVVHIQVKKSINLKQIKEDDFLLIKGQYRLKWNCSAKYVQFLMKPIMEEKNQFFSIFSPTTEHL